ncbi:fas-binding factor 1 homolog [Gigantopelta aegis]|uniref:fas-binding factor 1 homolog n=1 Tax=Gigantopelta aegis TaxID=1735272 RepID=UPI001B88A302|nr:fas-binding factor 1 homolog [Gigantopelta aegis]
MENIRPGVGKRPQKNKDYDDILGDLLAPDDVMLKKKPGQPQTVAQTPGKKAGKSALSNEMYSSLAAQAGNDADEEISDADVSEVARALAGLDDMDADLFGGTLPKKKGSLKERSNKTTPRRTPRSRSGTPRSMAGGQRVASPTRSDSPTSPPESARSSLKRRTPKSKSPTVGQMMQKPGSAPGKFSDLSEASENLKPGQTKADERPRTVPKAKARFDFGEFDEDDPLAGILSDSDLELSSQIAQKTVFKQQKSLDEPIKSKDSEPARKKNVFDRPPTRSGSSGKPDEDVVTESPPKPAEPPPKVAEPVQKAKPEMRKKDEVIFSEDDDMLFGLEEKKEKPELKSKPMTKDGGDKPAKSIMDSFLGKGVGSKLFEPKEKKDFVLDKKYTQAKDDKEEEDFLFGSYQPSMASGSRPTSRRSVRFQDDDDIFGLDKSSSRGRSQSPSKPQPVTDDMGWLEQAALPKPTANKVDTAPAKEKPVETKPKSSAADWLGLKESEDEEVFQPKKPVGPSPDPTEMNKLSPALKTESGMYSPRTNKKNVPSSPSLARPTPQKEDDYLQLGKEIDMDDILTTKPESPVFKGESPSVFSNTAGSGDLFQSPPTHVSTAVMQQPVERRRNKPIQEARLSQSAHRSQRRLSQELDQSLGSGENIQSGMVKSADTDFQHTQALGPTTQKSSILESFLQEPMPQIGLKARSGQMTSSLQAEIPPPTSLQPSTSPQIPQMQQQLAQQHALQQQLHQQQAEVDRMRSSLQQQLEAPGFPPNQDALDSGYQAPVSLPYQNIPPGGVPGSTAETYALVRKLEIEKSYAESLLESTKKRYDEELLAVENSYKKRMQILSESNDRKESRLLEETERLMEEHLSRVRQMEQERADLNMQHYRKLEEIELSKAQEMEKLKEQHRLAILELKREHEEAIDRLKRAKNHEIDAVANANDTSRSLTAVVSQIESNARDLEKLHQKVENWNRMGLDEREINLRSKDEQLKILQERLNRQEADNDNERKRLEDLIARMETQLRDQTRILDEERWKLKQEQNRIEALQRSLQEERRIWLEQQARDKEMFEKTRSSFLEEQRTSLSQLNEERRLISEERTKLSVDQKMSREMLQQEAIKSAQAKAEFEVLMKSIAEERAKSASKMQELRSEEDRIIAERARLERERTNLEHEKEKISNLALQVKQRSTEIESLAEMSAKSRSEGEQALMEAKRIEAERNHRLNEISKQIQNSKIMEEHIAQEKLKLSKEKKSLENLRNSSLCVNCRNPLRSDLNQTLPVYMPNGVNMSMMSPSNLMPVTPGHAGMNFSVNAIETITSSIASDRSIRMWKIQALKDKDYLEEESMFLEALRHSPYHSPTKT